MWEFAQWALVGFIAELICATLGMAYGVSASSLLLAFGLPPAPVSATVHAAETFVSGVCAASHHYFGNVDKRLFRRLVIPGVIGAVIGAYVLSVMAAGKFKPVIAAYLLVMGA